MYIKRENNIIKVRRFKTDGYKKVKEINGSKKQFKNIEIEEFENEAKNRKINSRNNMH